MCGKGETLNGDGDSDVIESIPRDLHLEQKLRPKWADYLRPSDWVPGIFKGFFNTIR